MEMVDLIADILLWKWRFDFDFQQVKKGCLCSIQQLLVNAGTAGVCVFSLLFADMRSEDPFWNSLSRHPGSYQKLKNEG